MSVDDSIQTLKQIDFKEINSNCSKNNLNLRVDDYAQKKFNTSLRTAYLLVTQPIGLAVQRQTKLETIQAIKDVKKVIDSLYLVTKDQKYKEHLDQMNEIISHSKLK